MPHILGVHLQPDELYFEQFLVERDEPPVYLSELRVPRSAFQKAAEDGTFSTVVPENVRSFLATAEEAEVVATFDPQKFVSERGSFPFRDPRKVDQIAMLQLEEEMPFDLNGFVLD